MSPTQKSHRIRPFPHRSPYGHRCLGEGMLQPAAGILLRRPRCFGSPPGIWTCEPASEMEGVSPSPDNTCTVTPPLTIPPFAEARVSQKQKIKTDWGKRLSFSWSNTKVHPFFLKERGSWWALPSHFMQLASITTLSHYLWIQTSIETLFVFPLIGAGGSVLYLYIPCLFVTARLITSNFCSKLYFCKTHVVKSSLEQLSSPFSCVSLQRLNGRARIPRGF